MYQTFAKDYDRFNNWKDRLAYEMPFINTQLSALKPSQGQKLSVLDAACGTGMHAIALAQQGMEVSGADLFPAMIRKARKNARNEGVHVEFRTAGFSTIASHFRQQEFDVLLCLGNSLPHVLSTDKLIAALEDFNLCMTPGGRLILQNRNFDQVMAQRNRWMEPQAYLEGDREWLFQRFYDFEPDGTIRFNILSLARQAGKDWKSQVNSTHLRPLLHAELGELLPKTGFGELAVYGDMKGSPYDPQHSPNLVICANKQ